jgi:hypothetical protein
MITIKVNQRLDSVFSWPLPPTTPQLILLSRKYDFFCKGDGIQLISFNKTQNSMFNLLLQMEDMTHSEQTFDT